MKTRSAANVLGVSLTRLESSRERASLISQADIDELTGARPIDRSDRLEAILPDYDDLPGGMAPIASEMCPADVAPMSIDKFLDQLQIRVQRGRENGIRAARQVEPVEVLPSIPAPWPTSDVPASDVPAELAGDFSSLAIDAAPAPATETPPLDTDPGAIPDPTESLLPPVEAAREESANRAPGEARENLDQLREIVVRSTQSTLVQHIRRRHQLVLVRKLLPIFLALAVASILSAAHFRYGVPPLHLAWAATAIGLIGLLGMVHLWSRSARRQARLDARISCVRYMSTKFCGNPTGRTAARAARCHVR